MSIVIRYHCDGCGQFISKGRVVTLHDPFSGAKGHYHPDCAKVIAPSRPVFTQELLKV
jgi:hypothetical protein